MSYRKTRLKNKGMLGIRSLWLGEDHLLQVQVSGCTERYRRFFYRDIQSIVIRPTNEQTIINAICGALAGLFAVLAFITRSTIEASVTLGVIAGVLLLGVLLNSLQGRGAKLYLLTPAGFTKVDVIRRLPKARRLQNLLISEIQAVQGVEMPEVPAGAEPSPEAAPAEAEGTVPDDGAGEA